ncbi:MAG: hypothetical protein ACPGRD_08005, partial [Planktomarina sp.]
MIGAFNIDELRQIRSQLRKTESLLRARGYLFAAEHIDDKPVIRPISPATLHSLESAEPIIGVVPSDIIQFAHIIGEVDFRGIPKHH